MYYQFISQNIDPWHNNDVTLTDNYSVGSLGFTTLVPYYLPVITTLMLLVRSYQLNQRNKRYCSNIVSKLLT